MTGAGAAPVTAAPHRLCRMRTHGRRRPPRTLVGVKSAETEFLGGPLDGRVLPVMLGVFHTVPKVYRVPVPGYHDTPPVTLVYRRTKVPGSKGWRWCYAYDEQA
ncbi:hypothetical protein KNE206_69430 [Kitasatospora sp. NE20-6]